jgi:hypothetical protein
VTDVGCRGRQKNAIVVERWFQGAVMMNKILEGFGLYLWTFLGA